MQLWFKRHEKPSKIEKLYEIGNYLVYDCESSQQIKLKKNFTIEYQEIHSEFF